ncbi:hypothetical protein BU24DRAFT_428476 [Aaosphaeria arxii CBS 175.79]|uniref:SP-RING-type domain-containing protein n=1 Tax=Aaosphaeria arxii CBS 175.79 TaxID=1450172 RepID=A0A6A5X937_9PLEO|nr:uncharacterized protein BU24DRAFT_428476 [Aaosphaeria arxii CBS 175.79]KAF2009585.1 hypothetical protein BU24DRAFT_428476 [Aaosphaeria arxii CBS 175.79]
MTTRLRSTAGGPSSHRQSTAAPPTASQERTQSRGDELPPYRKPSHPLDEQAQAKLQEVYNGRTASMLREHQQRAAKLITESAGSINDALKEHQEYVARRRKKWEQGKAVEEQEEVEQKLAELEEKVDKQTTRLEESMRSVIDTGEANERIGTALNWVRSNGTRRIQEEYNTQMSQQQGGTQSRHRARRVVDGEEDDDEADQPTPGPTPLTQARAALTGPSEMFTNQLEKQKLEYQSLPHNARYSKHNDYIGFKRMVHDARFGEDGPPLAHPDSWFTENGAPAPGITVVRTDLDDDDDIVIDKATISTRCPITFRQFEHPFSSTKCPHTFEKNAVLQYIRRSTIKNSAGQKVMQCPVPGCDQMISASDLIEDLILIRKIKRMLAAEQQLDESEAEDEGASHEGEEGAEPISSGAPARTQSQSPTPPI